MTTMTIDQRGNERSWLHELMHSYLYGGADEGQKVIIGEVSKSTAGNWLGYDCAGVEKVEITRQYDRWAAVKIVTAHFAKETA